VRATTAGVHRVITRRRHR